MSKISIVRGCLTVGVEGVGTDPDDGAYFGRAYQVREMDGAPITGSYAGKGTVTDDGRVILGDASNPTSFLAFYLVDSAQTAESVDSEQGYRLGFSSGRPTSKTAQSWSAAFLAGFQAGRVDWKRRSPEQKRLAAFNARWASDASQPRSGDDIS